MVFKGLNAPGGISARRAKERYASRISTVHIRDRTLKTKPFIMMKHLLSIGLLACLGVSGLYAAAEPEENTTTTKIVEEKTVTETRKVYETEAPKPTARKTAIIVDNRAGAKLNDKVAVLEDLLGRRVAGEGFSVLSRDIV